MKFLINLSKSGMDYSYEKRIGQSRRRGGYNGCPDHEELSFPVLASRVTRREFSRNWLGNAANISWWNFVVGVF